jgi:hypothetical protein
VSNRTQPLQAAPGRLSGAAAEAEAEMEALAHDVVLDGGPDPTQPHDPHAEAKRLQRLADGVRQLRTGGGTLKLGERTLMVIAGILAPLGLVLILVGWHGAAQTPNLFEQIPYAISGGLFGLGLLFLGSFCYFAHWMTELVKEHRAQSGALLEAITRLEDTMRASTARVDLPVSDVAAVNGVALVATDKGTMAHRPECTIVVGKTDLRAVTAEEGLAACKLCEPYAAMH